MGSRSGGRLGEDANPNGDRSDDGVLIRGLAIFSFFTFRVDLFFFILGRFVDFEPLETNDIYRRKADLEIPVRNWNNTTMNI